MSDDLLPSTAPLVMHTQHMNGLRRSFLCRVKKSTDQHQVPQVTKKNYLLLVVIVKSIYIIVKRHLYVGDKFM